MLSYLLFAVRRGDGIDTFGVIQEDSEVCKSPPLSHSPQKPLIGVSEDGILQALGRYHFLTGQQLCRLLYSPGSLTYVYDRLKRLTDAAYTLRLFLPRPTRSGSAPSVYTYARRGYKYLQEHSLDLPPRFHAAEAKTHSYLFLSHTLAVNDVLILLELLCRLQRTYSIAEVRHERMLKLQPITVGLPGGKKAAVIFDGWVDLRQTVSGETYQVPLALELDRGTEGAARWRRKVQGLIALLQAPSRESAQVWQMTFGEAHPTLYQEAFGTPYVSLMVVTTAGERRATLLRQWTETELRAAHQEGLAESFWFTSASAAELSPEQFITGAVWQRPFASTCQGLLETTAPTLSPTGPPADKPIVSGL